MEEWKVISKKVLGSLASIVRIKMAIILVTGMYQILTARVFKEI